MASEDREIYQRMTEPPYFSFQWVPLEENEETFDAAILVSAPLVIQTACGQT